MCVVCNRRNKLETGGQGSVWRGETGTGSDNQAAAILTLNENTNRHEEKGKVRGQSERGLLFLLGVDEQRSELTRSLHPTQGKRKKEQDIPSSPPLRWSFFRPPLSAISRTPLTMWSWGKDGVVGMCGSFYFLLLWLFFFFALPAFPPQHFFIFFFFFLGFAFSFAFPRHRSSSSARRGFFHLIFKTYTATESF